MTVAALIWLLAGCDGGRGDGDPEAPVLPPRSTSIAANEINPCDMLTAQQQSQLDLRSPTPANVVVDGVPSPACTWIGEDGIDFNVQFIPIDAQRAATATGAVLVQIGQFGAVKDIPADTAGGTPFCQLTIDTAPDQLIRIQARTRPGGPAPGIEAQCRSATDAASMVMTTVVATASR